MNRIQINQTGMFNTVSAYLDANKTIWNGVPAIVSMVTELNQGILGINQTGGKQLAPVTGASDIKHQVRHDLEEEILLLADQLAALAAVNNDVTLAAQTDLKLTALERLPEDGLEETGQRIAALTTENLAALADYNITAAEVTVLNNLVERFHAVKTAPRMAIAGRAGQTATLPDLIAKVTSLLRNRLDKSMPKFKKSNPDFYAGYLSARVVVDRGGSSPATPVPTAQPTPPAKQ